MTGAKPIFDGKRTTYRVDEVARILSCSRRTVYRRIEEGILESFRLRTGGGIRVLGASVKKMLENTDV